MHVSQIQENVKMSLKIIAPKTHKTCSQTYQIRVRWSVPTEWVTGPEGPPSITRSKNCWALVYLIATFFHAWGQTLRSIRTSGLLFSKIVAKGYSAHKRAPHPKPLNLNKFSSLTNKCKLTQRKGRVPPPIT